MVLINGIKYACERCIRGHRVTTCTHTDQPLTMIKPKGRPSSQCQHCRDQRKNKGLHIACACSKKGKPAGQHLASCYKSPSGCTCYQSHKLKALDKSKKRDSIPHLETSQAHLNHNGNVTNNMNSDNSERENDRESEKDHISFGKTSPDFNYLLDDSILGDLKSSNNGLFEVLSDDNYLHSNSNSSSITPHNHQSNESLNNHNNNAAHNNNSSDSSVNNTYKPKNNDANDIDEFPEINEVENSDQYFPLFPLVGNHTFENNEGQPLSSLPSNFQSSISRSHSNSFKNTNRPESVLSVNSNSSISTDVSKLDNSANPPSTLNYSTNHGVSGTQIGHGNFNNNNSITDIMETNEYNISNEEFDNFLNNMSDKKILDKEMIDLDSNVPTDFNNLISSSYNNDQNDQPN